jgi:hypothetical protein
MKRHNARSHQRLNCDLYWIPVSALAANRPCKVAPPRSSDATHRPASRGDGQFWFRVQTFVDEYSAAVIAIHIDRLRMQSFASRPYLPRQPRRLKALQRKIPLAYPTDNGMWPSPRHAPPRVEELIQGIATHEKTHRRSPRQSPNSTDGAVAFPSNRPRRCNRTEPRSEPEEYTDDNR